MVVLKFQNGERNIINFNFNVEEFLEDVEKLTNKNVDFLEALIVICERKGLEIETVISFVKKSSILKAKLENVAIERNLLKK